MNPPKPQTQKLDHIPALDGVRGIAILLVLLTHLRMILSSVPVSRYFEFGWMGVDLFFVLSGFLITRILLKTRTQSGYYTRFYIRRGLRIWPLYYGFVMGTAGLLLFVPHWSVFQRVVHPSSYLLEAGGPIREALPFYFLFLQNLFPLEPSALRDYAAITWSLCIEEHFYLLWPFAVRALTLSGLQRVCVVILLLSPIARMALLAINQSSPSPYVSQLISSSTPFHLDGIAAGCLLSVYWSQWKDPAVFRGLFKWLLIGGGIASVTTYLFLHIDSMQAICYSALAVFFTGFVAWALLGGMQGIFLNPALCYTGRISYGLYLIHYPVFIVCQSHQLSARWAGTLSTAGSQTLAALLAVAVSYAVASLSWHCIERPLLSLKDRWRPARSGTR